MNEREVVEMPLGRRHERGEERRQDRRGDEGLLHDEMRQRLVSIGDDFWIETERVARVKDSVEVEDPDGNRLATPDQDPVTVLAAIVGIDMIAHESR